MPTPGPYRSGRPAEALHGTDLTFDYSSELLTSLAARASEAFLKFSFGGLEVGGVLFGHREEKGIRILAFRQVPCRYANGPGFLLSPDDEAALGSLLADYAQDSALAGMIPVGWYHSHTRSAMRLSPEDVVIHDRYFTELWHLALILRPELGKPVRVGFFLRGSTRIIDPARPWYEMKVEIPSPDATRSGPPPLKASDAPASIPREPRPEPELPAFLRVPARAPAAPRKKRRVLLVLALLAALLALAAAAFRLRRNTPQSASLNARVFDQKGVLRLEWVPPGDAVSGLVEVSQGGEASAFRLDTAQVKKGSAEFARHAQDVQLRLVVRRAGGELLREFTRFVKAAAVPDVEGAIGRASEERQRLMEEVRRAREELRQEIRRKEAIARRYQELRRKVDSQDNLAGLASQVR